MTDKLWNAAAMAHQIEIDSRIRTGFDYQPYVDAARACRGTPASAAIVGLMSALKDMEKKLEALDTPEARVKHLAGQLENDTQDALQKIGEEFGVLGGEPRIDGIRRILTEQRARIRHLELRYSIAEDTRP